MAQTAARTLAVPGNVGSAVPVLQQPPRFAHGTGPVEIVKASPSAAAIVEADRIHAILQGRDYNQNQIVDYATILLKLAEGRKVSVPSQDPIELSAIKYWDLHRTTKGPEYIAGLATYLRDDAAQQIDQEERACAIYDGLVSEQKFTGRQVLAFAMDLMTHVVSQSPISKSPTAPLSKKIFNSLMDAGGTEQQVLGVVCFLIGFSTRSVALELTRK